MGNAFEPDPIRLPCHVGNKAASTFKINDPHRLSSMELQLSKNICKVDIKETAREPLHKTPTHVLAHACRVRQHPGLCNKLISA